MRCHQIQSGNYLQQPDSSRWRIFLSNWKPSSFNLLFIILSLYLVITSLPFFCYIIIIMLKMYTVHCIPIYLQLSFAYNGPTNKNNLLWFFYLYYLVLCSWIKINKYFSNGCLPTPYRHLFCIPHVQFDHFLFWF